MRWLYRDVTRSRSNFEVYEIGFYAPDGAWECQQTVNDLDHAIRIVARLNGGK